MLYDEMITNLILDLEDFYLQGNTTPNMQFDIAYKSLRADRPNTRAVDCFMARKLVGLYKNQIKDWTTKC